MYSASETYSVSLARKELSLIMMRNILYPNMSQKIRWMDI